MRIDAGRLGKSISFYSFYFLAPFVGLAFVYVDGIIVAGSIPAVAAQRQCLGLEAGRQGKVVQIDGSVVCQVIVDQCRIEHPYFLPFIIREQQMPFRIGLHGMAGKAVVARTAVAGCPAVAVHLLVIFRGGILLFVNADHSVLVACENQPVLYRHGLCLEYGAAPLPVAYAGEVGQFRQPEYMDARLAFGHIQPVARRHDGFYLTSETLLPAVVLPALQGSQPFTFLYTEQQQAAACLSDVCDEKGIPQMGDGIRGEILGRFHTQGFRINQLRRLIRVIPVTVIIPVSFSFPVSSAGSGGVAADFIQGDFAALCRQDSGQHNQDISVYFHVVLTILYRYIFISAHSWGWRKRMSRFSRGR